MCPDETVPMPVPGEARALLGAGRFEEALGLCHAVRRSPPDSRALRALWAAFEQDLAEALLARSRAAQSAAEAGVAARWLGMLERLDPELAQRAERSWVRRLAAAAQALGRPAGAAAPGPLSAAGDTGFRPGGGEPGAGCMAHAGSGPIQMPSGTPPAMALPGPLPGPLASPQSPPSAAALPGGAGGPGTAPALARLLADDLGEWLLVAAERLWFAPGEPLGSLPLDLPGLGAGQELCITRASRAGFLAFERRGPSSPWAPLGALDPGLALSLGPRARPTLRLLPRWLAGTEAPCLALSFERGVVAGEAQGLVWLGGELSFGAAAGNLLRAPSLASAHRFQFDGDSLSLCGPGPIRRLGPPGQPPEDRLQELFRCPFPPPQRFEFELGGGRPPLWMRLEPLEARP